MAPTEFPILLCINLHKRCMMMYCSLSSYFCSWYPILTHLKRSQSCTLSTTSFPFRSFVACLWRLSKETNATVMCIPMPHITGLELLQEVTLHTSVFMIKRWHSTSSRAFLDKFTRIHPSIVSFTCNSYFHTSVCCIINENAPKTEHQMVLNTKNSKATHLITSSTWYTFIKQI